MAASSNASVRSALGVAGAVLAVAAQACLARPERWRSWLPTTPDGSLNAILRWMSPLDAAVGAAVLALLLATGLMAYALRPFMTLGLPAGTGVPANTIPPTRDGRFGLLLGVTIAALLAFFLVPALRPAAAWIWLAALAWPAIFLRRFDLRVGPRGLRPLFSRGEVLLLASVAGGVLILVGHDLTAVSWAGLGDEIRFFTTAKEILQGQFSRDPLSEDGLWGYHPVLSHLWQAMFMRVLGPTQFAWRLSSLVAFIIALPPFYFFVRVVRAPTVAPDESVNRLAVGPVQFLDRLAHGCRVQVSPCRRRHLTPLRLPKFGRAPRRGAEAVLHGAQS
ncbi:hypothetical protein AYO41_03740 [Verrucomicrobia bacterium SCGC AG-212-E04]|nr:hypothetical protein AYO41_03740 [Verrucomicrobia bacterium SCGC AG-212-E04]